MGLDEFVADFARALTVVDSRQPIALNQRSKVAFRAGIGPHSEASAVRMIGEELRSSGYENVKFGVPYPSAPRQRCDLCLMPRDGDTWVVEVKLLRFRGDNAQPNDNMLMHILSPYPAHRSALTDCDKLLASGFVARKAILIYGFDDDEWPLVPAIEAFEQLARNRVSLSPRSTAQSGALCHPVHKNASVYAWELL